LVEIGSVVSEVKPLNQIKPNMAGMVPGWVPFKIVSDSAVLYPRWPLLLKIEISSVGSQDHRTQICKGAIQESFQQSLVEIGSVVSEENFFFISSALFSHFVLYPRWPPLQKREISSNGQNCSILSQNVPKFKRYKHNDELFNMYYRTFL
jgi:hypothetical protein